MENQIQIFEHEEFGILRTVLIDSDALFLADDACRILKYPDIFEALKKYVKDDEKYFIDQFDLMGLNSNVNVNVDVEIDFLEDVAFIDGWGLFALIENSTLPHAKEFGHWITSKILPTLYRLEYDELTQAERDFALIMSLVPADMTLTEEQIQMLKEETPRIMLYIKMIIKKNLPNHFLPKDKYLK